MITTTLGVALYLGVAVNAVPSSPLSNGVPGLWRPSPGFWSPVNNPYIPPWIASAPWMQAWGPCTTLGPSCNDCTTRVICTKLGSLLKACTDPALPYCDLGQCVAAPNAQCAPDSQTGDKDAVEHESQDVAADAPTVVEETDEIDEPTAAADETNE